ncbi:hypothetical protein MHUMG1_07897 [Metarhizium humberi]|uniref:Uncharacterized protein n=1 Tax=Metarhizium humberi TaxID=2596975 RepID=A0A9P8M6N9_9HYPO|nr:hypothetical protein MHUMG1_07897 [Metarhizium humberi]
MTTTMSTGKDGPKVQVPLGTKPRAESMSHGVVNLPSMPVLPSPKTVPSLVTICIIPIALTLQLNAGKRTTTVAEVGVSFGFDIYDSITTYLDAVKCHSEELASVREKDKALKGLLTGRLTGIN